MSKDERSLAEIEADIARTRLALGATLGALERKFAPQQLFEKGVVMIGRTVSETAAGVGQAVARNPLPLVMIGAGIGWWWLSSRKRVSAPAAHAANGYNGSPPIAESETYTDPGDLNAISRTAARIGQLAADVEAELRSSGDHFADDAVSRLRDGINPARSHEMGVGAPEESDPALGATIRRFGEAVYDEATDYVDEAVDAVRDAGDRVLDMADRYPLAIGGIAALAGVLLALGLPYTAQEDRVLGGARDNLRDRALDSGRDALARAEETVSLAAAAALDAAREDAGAGDVEPG